MAAGELKREMAEEKENSKRNSISFLSRTTLTHCRITEDRRWARFMEQLGEGEALVV